MFCYQENTHFSQALPCKKEVFWEQVKNTSNQWKIDSRRDILDVVERHDEEGIARWLNNSEYQRFLAKKRDMKKLAARQKFFEKSDEERLLAFAQELKDNLTAFIFSCREFDATPTANGNPFCHRRLADCHLNGLVMLDIDHVENPLEVFEAWKRNDELVKRTAFVHITSSKKGIRFVFTADIRFGNLADQQIVYATALGYPCDQSTIDATRNSFTPKEEDILYINEELLFNYYDEAFDKEFTPMYRDKKTQPLNHQFPTDDGAAGSDSTKVAAVASKGDAQGSGDVGQVDAMPVEDLKWRGYDIQGIIDARYSSKLPCQADSNRHTESLKLATDLLLMLDGDKARVQRIVEAQPWVEEIIAERDEDVGQTVSSAADCVAQKEKKYASSLPSKAMLEAVKAFTGKPYQEIIAPGSAFLEAGKKAQWINEQLEKWGEEIEALWSYYPFIKDVCYGLKRSQYPAALFVAGGTAMTLMTRTWYRFYHRPQQERRLNCSLFIIGHPASNKSMADDIFELLSAPIAAADKAGKAALNRYKKDQKKKAANKEGKDKPEALIRLHPARTSNGQLIQDMINAKETIEGKEIQLHMVTFDTELDNSITLQQGGSWINKQSMELKAFHNEKDGQMYQNSDSPVDEFYVTWNFIYTGTPIALKKKVTPQNFGSGLSTRLAVIPMPKTNYEMIKFEEQTSIDWERLNRMKEWAYKLDARYGELPFWGLVKNLYGWMESQMADCAEDESEANELMLKRVPYHAINYSAPFIDMRHWNSLHQEGNYWTGTYETDEIDWKLCELIARIQYATQQHFFGVMAEKYFDDMNNDVQFSGKRHYQKSVNGYNQLPEVFTKDDVMKCFGYNNRNVAYTKIKRLIDQNLATQITDGEDKGKYKKVSDMR